MSKSYSLIIFDLDGTLINSVPYHLDSFKQVLSKRGVKIDDKFLEGISGLTSTGMFKELKKEYKFKDSIEKLKIERRKYFFKATKKKDLSFRGVKTLIKRLKLNYKIAIATSSSKLSLKSSLNKDIYQLFNAYVTSDDVKNGKPSPAQINLIIKKLKARKKETILIGDTIYDALSAKRAGIDFIGVATGRHTSKALKENGALKVIDSVNELKKVF